ncbi:PilW family protein [Microbulbifer hainanensis]|uniref:PilW family protein n=1 Tax=Microbulbifer hainanensis TaxID=2735675 RepID=UPI0018681C86|nr:PilW family protein [Microbulbifer hainanensis]
MLKQRGLSLIELMIAILLSSLLLLGVLQIFDGNRNTIRMQNAFARVQESGRYAMDMLTREVRMADYWGCAPDKGSIRNHLDTSDPDYDPNVQDQYGADGILGQDNVSGVSIGGVNVIDGTDILTLSGASDACGGTGRMVPSVTAASLAVTPNCPVKEGQIVLITNCQSGELMTITNVQDGTGGDSGKKTIVHNTGSLTVGFVENATKNMQREYGADAKVLLPYQRKYFVADNSDGERSLFVSEDGGTPQELVPGIEDLQLLFGRDTDDDDVVDTWQPAVADKTQMEQALTVKIEMVVSSDNTVGAKDFTVTDIDGESTTYGDRKLHRVYLTTAKVRNRGAM